MQSLVRATLFNAVFFLAGSSLVACSGSISSSGGADDADGNSGGTGGSDIPPPDPNFKPMGDPDVNKLTCAKSGTAVAAAPLRRLTRKQYTNTLNDLLGGITPVPPDLQLPSESVIDGFDNNAVAQTSTLALLQGYKSAATAMAKDATSNAGKLAKLAPCDQGQAEDLCGDKFIKDFGRRAFRRPLATDEVERLAKVYKAVAPGFGHTQGIEATLTAMLLAPEFIFRPEYGSGTAIDGAVKLTSHEVASRLSYLLWDTMPDAELFAAADAKKLDTADGIETQLRRMMNDPRAREAVQRFSSQWLGIAKFDAIEKDSKAFPKFDAATKASMRTSMEKFIDYAFWEKGSLHALLTDSNAFVDDKLAPIYGVDGSADMKMVSLDSAKRSGVLTQAGLMASLAKTEFDSPVHRGLFVIHNLLCTSMPDPPMNVPALVEPKPGDAPRTTRARLEKSHSIPQCAACHNSIDGIGFGFGHYDAVGAYRDEENGIAVDVSGELVGTRDVDGKFNGAVEMGGRLAQSSQVQQCVATQWFRYGFGKTESDNDSCALKPIVDAFVASRGDMKKLLAVLVKSDAFRYRNAL